MGHRQCVTVWFLLCRSFLVTGGTSSRMRTSFSDTCWTDFTLSCSASSHILTKSSDHSRNGSLAWESPPLSPEFSGGSCRTRSRVWHAVMSRANMIHSWTCHWTCRTTVPVDPLILRGIRMTRHPLDLNDATCWVRFFLSGLMNGHIVKRNVLVPQSDCLSSFIRLEELEDTELYLCQNCKKKQKSTKRFWIRRLPNVLCLHLKRFRWNNYLRTKLDTFVEFPLRGLDMSQYVLSNKVSPQSEYLKLCSHVVHV
jgi:hypothetical protein